MKAFSVIEVLIAAAVASIGLAALVAVMTFALGISSRVRETAEARSRAQETLEAVRDFRDVTAWSNDDPADQYDGLGVVLLGSPYHPALSSDQPPRVMLLPGSEMLGVFERSVVFSEVRRDINNDIVAIGGSVDADTKKVTASVLWASGTLNRRVELVTYLTNWR